MNNEIVQFSLTVFIGFLAIMNPIANTPIFLGLVDGRSQENKKKIARTSCTTAFIIVIVFTLLGKFIFDLFGITIPAFKITGGILLFFVGFEMLQSKKSSIKHLKESELDDSIAISPLAIPILAGPGTIVTAMNYVIDGSIQKIVIVIIAFAILVFITYLAFTFSDLIVKRIGNNLITVIGKIMGLIIAIIGTGMAVEGIKLSFGLK